MKKTFLLLTVMIVSCILFFSCKKNDDKQVGIVGYWVGQYGSGDAAPSVDYCFLIKEDGRIRVYSNSADTTIGDRANGTYTFQGSTLTAYYAFSPDAIYSTTAVLKGNRLEGSWGNRLSNSNGGTYFAVKK